ncbi:MAG: hypothetical protein ACPG8V_04315 [Alphaproteobacteria bacterium]
MGTEQNKINKHLIKYYQDKIVGVESDGNALHFDNNGQLTYATGRVVNSLDDLKKLNIISRKTKKVLTDKEAEDLYNTLNAPNPEGQKNHQNKSKKDLFKDYGFDNDDLNRVFAEDVESKTNLLKHRLKNNKNGKQYNIDFDKLPHDLKYLMLDTEYQGQLLGYPKMLTAIEKYQKSTTAEEKEKIRDEIASQTLINSSGQYNINRNKQRYCSAKGVSGDTCDLRFNDYVQEEKKKGRASKFGTFMSTRTDQLKNSIKVEEYSEQPYEQQNQQNFVEQKQTEQPKQNDTSADGKMIYVPEQKSGKKENKPENKQDDVVKDFINTLPDDLKGIVNIADIMSGGLFKKAKQQKTPPIDDTLSQDTKDLTQEQIKQTMDSDEYRDSKNPLAELTRGKVNDWFKTFFPGEAKYDETGKMERTPPVMQFPKEAKKPKTKDGNSPNDFLGNVGAGLQTIINATGGNEQKVVKDYQKTVNQANQGTKEPVLKEDGDFGVKTASATKRMGQRKKAFELIDKTAKQTYSNQNMAEVLKRKVDNNKPKYTGEYDTEPRTLQEEKKRERLAQQRHDREMFKNRV